ncbi:hypothetical protein [Sphingobacterium bambusae]|uniref:Uncharacterized protein n=1 Tax=Sphingobacterium bambusae TaxID=662858 RepID=A0ABW6BAI3_9SPHI|nr:hypothetical protein [Sphingobacterium bambusae]WPL48817.1 hypothetical protein SCB77_22965 [Sphingobacterium bambusae]
MKLEIKAVNCTEDNDWMVKLANADKEIFYIMSSSFYSFYKLKTPISKREIDFYETGLWINVEAAFLGGKNVS